MDRAEWSKKSYTECPNLYIERNLPMTETCMCWGFEVPDEWMETIYNLSVKLEALIVDQIAAYGSGKDDFFHGRAVQVKEKFGGLRFYMNGSTDEMEELIDEAELQIDQLDKSEDEEHG